MSIMFTRRAWVGRLNLKIWLLPVFLVLCAKLRGWALRIQPQVPRLHCFIPAEMCGTCIFVGMHLNSSGSLPQAGLRYQRSR